MSSEFYKDFKREKEATFRILQEFMKNSDEKNS
jgi:hypothetical protein